MTAELRILDEEAHARRAEEERVAVARVQRLKREAEEQAAAILAAASPAEEAALAGARARTVGNAESDFGAKRR